MNNRCLFYFLIKLLPRNKKKDRIYGKSVLINRTGGYMTRCFGWVAIFASTTVFGGTTDLSCTSYSVHYEGSSSFCFCFLNDNTRTESGSSLYISANIIGFSEPFLGAGAGWGPGEPELVPATICSDANDQLCSATWLDNPADKTYFFKNPNAVNDYFSCDLVNGNFENARKYTPSSTPISPPAETPSDAASVDLNLDIHIPSAEFQTLDGTSNIWVDLEFKGVNSDGDYIWRLQNYGENQR